MITEKDLQLAFHSSTFGRYDLIMPNVHILHNEMDIIGVRKSGFVDEVKKPPRLHSRKISDDRKYEIAKKAVFRYWNNL